MAQLTDVEQNVAVTVAKKLQSWRSNLPSRSVCNQHVKLA